MALIFPEGTQQYPSKIIQIQTSNYGTVFTKTNTSWENTGLGCTITPTNENNRILILVNANLNINNSGATDYYESEFQYRLTASISGSTQNNPMYGGTQGYRLTGNGSSKKLFTTMSMKVGDGPFSGGSGGTSARTYRLQFGGGGGTFSMSLNSQPFYHGTGANPNETSNITCIEYEA